MGGKFKLLSEIIPVFPDKIDTFIDLFGGGFNVGINVAAEKVIYNDTCTQVVELLKFLKENEVSKSLNSIEKLISDYKLSKENQDGFLKLREYYNEENDNPLVFYTLICYAFNNQIRFNKNGKYNMPFGKNRSSFNPALRNKFVDFCNALHNCKCGFSNLSFDKFDFSNITKFDFVYADPPYFNSVATYNESGGWTENEERKLLDLLDFLNQKEIKFALSNNLKYENPMLDIWKNKYNVHYLSGNYSNCSYHKIDKSKDCEVLITNY